MTGFAEEEPLRIRSNTPAVISKTPAVIARSPAPCSCTALEAGTPLPEQGAGRRSNLATPAEREGGLRRQGGRGLKAGAASRQAQRQGRRGVSENPATAPSGRRASPSDPPAAAR